MEYIKKEELIEGEIYKANSGGLTFIMKATKNLNNVINIPSYNEFMKNGNFNGSHSTFINATSEEKHWLNTCIEQDKFITFEEAMKTFIPEYVECIKLPDTVGHFNLFSATTIGKIYKVDNWKKSSSDCTLVGETNGSCNRNRFKPSTKEAYDAQFIVKEPEFVLPEKWFIQRNSENFVVLNEWKNHKRGNHVAFYQNNNCSMFSDKDYDFTASHNISGYTEITFEQFKKYVLKKEIVVKEIVEEKVIEPLPQFKVIETIETITKVENNEGNQFFIGDVVISSNKTVQIIESFDYNKAKTNIIAFTNKQSILGNGIGIDKIEHYIEPKVIKPEFILPKKWFIFRNNENFEKIGNWFNKINKGVNTYTNTSLKYNYPYLYNSGEDGNCLLRNPMTNFTEITFDQFKKYVLKEEVKEETLLEKAKRLYPVGTTISNYNLGKGCVFKTNSETFYEYLYKDILVKCPGIGNYTIYCNNEWATIIK